MRGGEILVRVWWQNGASTREHVPRFDGLDSEPLREIARKLEAASAALRLMCKDYYEKCWQKARQAAGKFYSPILAPIPANDFLRLVFLMRKKFNRKPATNPPPTYQSISIFRNDMKTKQMPIISQKNDSGIHLRGPHGNMNVYVD